MTVECKKINLGGGGYDLPNGAFSMDKLDEKSKSPLFPGAEGVVTQWLVHIVIKCTDRGYHNY